MKYGVDERLGLGALLLYGLQWWVVSLPCVVVMGMVAARLYFHGDPGLQAFYLQKLFAVTGAATIAQILFGHRMPLVIGPPAILLVGMIASAGQGMYATHTAMLVGGAALTLLALSGFLGRLRFFFTPRIVAVILVLIAVTLMPTILKLALDGHQGRPAFHLGFTAVMALALVIFNRLLPGVMKSMTVIIGIGGGALVYFAFTGWPAAAPPVQGSGASSLLIEKLDFHAGTVISFLFCFLALLINELGSIESLGHMLKLNDMPSRIRRSVGLLGLTNMAAGSIGVIGSVDYSLSAGVIAATGNASRFTLLPAGVALMLCALSSEVVLILSYIPGAVMAALMLYLMSAQLSSGLAMLVVEKGVTGFESGVTVGLPLMTGLLVAFAPAEVLNGIPDLVRPIAGNGFVIAAMTVVVLEHLVFRIYKKK